MTKEDVKKIAYIAWKGAANAHRMYPGSKHTFTEYWGGAESQFNKFCKADVRLALPTDRDIAIQIVASFLHNPHPNQRKNYDREKKAFADGAKWAIKEIEKKNKGNEA